MKDFLGQELTIGDYVSGLFSDNETPILFQIVDFTPKKVKLQPVGDPDTTASKFPRDLLMVSKETMAKILEAPPVDAVGQDLAIGDYAFGSGGTYIDPIVFEITGFAPMTATVKKVYGPKYYVRSSIRLTTDLVKLDASLVTMHCLTKEHKS